MSTPPHGTEVRKSNEILEHAKDFLNQYFTSIKRVNSESHKSRWKNIEKEVLSTGSYQLTETELIFGAKLAWRNASRCIGRIQWSKLQMNDTSSPTALWRTLRGLGVTLSGPPSPLNYFTADTLAQNTTHPFPLARYPYHPKL
uniref:nitric-oxide synthase (NADPH) n=1 Tax=Trichogramma kaykai TaxID=54128 RepID=A0ABD2W4Z8_9HYME